MNALDAVMRIGHDFIQRNRGGGSVDTGNFTPGTSAQREKWFTGHRTGLATRCDTFRATDLG